MLHLEIMSVQHVVTYSYLYSDLLTLKVNLTIFIFGSALLTVVKEYSSLCAQVLLLEDLELYVGLQGSNLVGHEQGKYYLAFLIFKIEKNSN